MAEKSFVNEEAVSVGVPPPDPPELGEVGEDVLGSVVVGGVEVLLSEPPQAAREAVSVRTATETPTRVRDCDTSSSWVIEHGTTSLRRD